jgi:5'/3'-nucleotidase SurE
MEIRSTLSWWVLRFSSFELRINTIRIFVCGIHAFFTSYRPKAARFGDVRIVAPDVEQSSMSHAITSSRPLRFKRIHLGELEAHSVNGTPADCVALGMHK